MVPANTSRPYVDTTDTLARMEALSSGMRGEKSLRLRLTVEDIVRHIRRKDYLSQLAAIYDWFSRHWTYVNDPVEVELVKDPERILEEIAKKGRALGDCDDAAVFLRAAPRTIGIPARFARATFTLSGARRAGLRGDADPYSHVFVVAVDQYGRPVVLDPVAGRSTAEMISRATASVVGLSGWR